MYKQNKDEGTDIVSMRVVYLSGQTKGDHHSQKLAKLPL